MIDEQIRAAAADQPVPKFDRTPFVVPPRLSAARVAVVTTAALHHPLDEPLRGGDQSFRVLDPDRPLVFGHGSPNFDRSGWLADPEVILPVQRLRELAADGTIGSVGRRHLAFAGNQPDETLSTLRMDTGRAAAAALHADGVQIAVLTGV